MSKTTPPPPNNSLFYGDNLQILRNYISDESVDLIYLDPPFNSNANYNVLFRAPDGESSQSQIEAFDDTWHWNESAEKAFDQVISSGNSEAAEMLRAMRSFLKENDMMAYLAMMSVRLIELHRALKPTGSLYLHCDPTASHYLKILLDAIFGPTNFLNEIIWRRTGSHNNARRYGPIHDVIHFYRKSPLYKHRPIFRPYSKGHVDSYFKKIDERGKYWTNSVHGKGIRHGESGQAWQGYDVTSKGRHWAIPSDLIEALGIDPELKSLAKLDALNSFGVLDLPDPSSGSLPTYRQYLDRSPGVLLQDIWAYQPHTRGNLYNSDEAIDEDVRWLVAQGDADRLGYETQKPVGLLERIIAASSNEGDLVLDPFCGCGTTVHAAQKLNRRWIGIDVTHLAIGLIKRRLSEAFKGATFDIVGVPQDVGGATTLAEADKYEFQKWALSMIDAVPYKGGKKGGDGGVDGYVYFKPDGKTTEKAIVSVKGGVSLTPSMVKDLVVTVDNEKAKMGIFLTLTPPTKGMVTEAAKAGFYKTDYGQFPKIQIVTIEQLFAPSNPIQMPWQDTSAFKKAKKENTEKQSKLDL